MIKTALDPASADDAARWSCAAKDWTLTFLRSPVQFEPASDSNRVGVVHFAVNRLEVYLLMSS